MKKLQSKQSMKIEQLKSERLNLVKESYRKIKWLYYTVAGVVGFVAYLGFGASVGYHIINPITHMLVAATGVAFGFGVSAFVNVVTSKFTKEAKQARKIAKEIKSLEIEKFLKQDTLLQDFDFKLSNEKAELRTDFSEEEIKNSDKSIKSDPSLNAYKKSKQQAEKNKNQNKDKDNSSDNQKLF